MRRPTPEQARHAREAKVRKQAVAKTPPANTTVADAPAAATPPRVPYEQYRNGPDGFIRWAEDHINVSITPAGGTMEKWVPLSDLPDTPHLETGRSYRQMWKEKKKDETLFFDYRFSKTGVHSDYWNPNQAQTQLKSYRIKQDDLMFSLAWAIYGGRALSVQDFRSRGSQPFWGTMIQPRDLVGKW